MKPMRLVGLTASLMLLGACSAAGTATDSTSPATLVVGSRTYTLAPPSVSSAFLAMDFSTLQDVVTYADAVQPWLTEGTEYVVPAVFTDFARQGNPRWELLTSSALNFVGDRLAMPEDMTASVAAQRDLIGKTPQEVLAILAATAPDKRADFALDPLERWQRRHS